MNRASLSPALASPESQHRPQLVFTHNLIVRQYQLFPISNLLQPKSFFIFMLYEWVYPVLEFIFFFFFFLIRLRRAAGSSACPAK